MIRDNRWWDNAWIVAFFGGLLVNLVWMLGGRWWASVKVNERLSRVRISAKRQVVSHQRSPHGTFGSATAAGGIAGLTVLFFYRALLPLLLRRLDIRDFPGMVAGVWSNTDNREVFSGLLAGSMGGLLLATSSVFRRRLRPMQAIAIDIATFLLGGATLALAQLSIGHASVPWSQTHWVEFFVFGGGASVALIHLADFHERLSARQVVLSSLIPSLIGAGLFGLMAELRPIFVGLQLPPQPGYEGWLFATGITCPVFVATLLLIARSSDEFIASKPSPTPR